MLLRIFHHWMPFYRGQCVLRKIKAIGIGNAYFKLWDEHFSCSSIIDACLWSNFGECSWRVARILRLFDDIWNTQCFLNEYYHEQTIQLKHGIALIIYIGTVRLQASRIPQSAAVKHGKYIRLPPSRTPWSYVEWIQTVVEGFSENALTSYVRACALNFEWRV